MLNLLTQANNTGPVNALTINSYLVHKLKKNNENKQNITITRTIKKKHIFEADTNPNLYSYNTQHKVVNIWCRNLSNIGSRSQNIFRVDTWR